MSSDRPTTAAPRDLYLWARSELERRLRSGEPCRAEDLLASYPALSSEPEQAVELILSEIHLRRELGEVLDPSECYARFPQFQRLLESRLNSLTSGDATRTEPGALDTAKRGEPGLDLTLGRHELIEEIGRGGMGVVYRARDISLDRLVALKMIRSGASKGPEVDRFQREAQAAARLRHANIAPIYAIGFHEGQPCFTMPLIEGGTLALHGKRYQQDTRAAVTLMAKVTRAIDAAHRAGVIHRDLKPANILLDAGGEPLVADFGLAKLTEGDAEATYSGGLAGTPAYMAPEQSTGQRVSPATDVWAMGVILYELLAGRRPFDGPALDLPRSIAREEPATPRSLRPHLSRELEAVILRCLEKEPERRYASASELAEELDRWLRGEPVHARPPSWQRRLRDFLKRAAKRPVGDSS